ncbi:hypothetical protein GCM10022255_094620 [Dactylosporangium darangshiense]|uniref:Uncharacterized protein n=1 Tax=Dactylosporangium darangshiense TaxID=579108 RepID=A0ABP8DQ50_9ACTN
MHDRGHGVRQNAPHTSQCALYRAAVRCGPIQSRAQALAGLELMLRPGNDWYDTWIDGDEDGEGARTAHAIAAVLRSSSG